MGEGAPRIIEVGETGSTNADAMARALAGEPLPFWLTAERQTEGKGRSGRPWQSVEGNLHASLALHLACGPLEAAQLSLVAGVAVIDALAAVAPGSRFRLKWPNDILCEGAKAGGILVETVSNGAGGGLVAVIGIGLNTASAPKIEGRATTSLAALGHAVSLKSIVAVLAQAMDIGLRLWNEGRGFDAVRHHWLDAALPIGTALTVHAGAATAEGRFAGLDTDGALLLQDLGGRVQRFTFGDVTLTS